MFLSFPANRPVTALFLALSCLLGSLAAQDELMVRNLKVSAEPVFVSERWLILSVDGVLHVHDLLTGQTRSLRAADSSDVALPPRPPRLMGNWFAFAVSESGQQEDLNGDGDTEDRVPHVHNLETAETRNLGLADAGRVPLHLSRNWFVFTVSERAQGDDLDGNGSVLGRSIVHAHNLTTGKTVNLALNHWDSGGRPGWFLRLWEDWLAFRVDERTLHVRNLETGQTQNWDRGQTSLLSSGEGLEGLVSRVSESVQVEDLNGDGDLNDEIFHVLDLESGLVQNLELASGFGFGSFCRIRHRVSYSGRRIALGAWEPGQREDLNGDGDVEDHVLHIYDFDTHETTNLEVAINTLGPFAGNWLASTVNERCDGEDLNGDGDDIDRRALQVHNIQNGRTANLELAGYPGPLSGGWLTLRVSEEEQGEDLNGDGDTEDDVLHVHDLESGDTENLELVASDILGFFEEYLVFTVDAVLHVHNPEDSDTESLGAERFLLSTGWLAFERAEADRGEDSNDDGDINDNVVQLFSLATGETVDVGLAGRLGLLSERWLVMTVSELQQGEDLNDDGDVADEIVHVIALPPVFLRGDCNSDGRVNLSDAACILTWLFAGQAAPGCVSATNTNGDDMANVADATYLLNHLFAGGPAPFTPFPDCGPGTLPTDQELGCEAPLDCR